MPEEDKDVLVTREFLGLKIKHKGGWNDHIKPCRYVEIASHIDGCWSALSDEYKVSKDRHTDPIAWMPLPAPYGENEENKDIEAVEIKKYCIKILEAVEKAVYEIAETDLEFIAKEGGFDVLKKGVIGTIRKYLKEVAEWREKK